MGELKLHKCKLCGEPLDITKAVGGAVRCGYCGTMYTLPKETADDRLLNFLDSGELSLDKGDFEGAITSYSKAAEIDGNEPEAHFGKALSKFKVRYIKDEVANRLQPICYEVTDKKFSDDPDYMRAYMKATPEQRAVYEEKAKDIDYIQSEFYNLKQSGLDYDCFICVKVTDDKTHAKTEDSKDADYIYHLLKDKGYKPFYSEYEIRNKQGADYEAHILYALYTSECMLIVCSDEEYLQTKWVKNEYSRFLKLVNDEEKDSDGITIVFKGKPIEKLPGKRGKLQGINFELRSADGQIVEFVDSHTPAARAKRATEAEAKAKADDEQKAKIKELEKQLENLKKAAAQPAVSAGNISYEELAKNIEKERLAREKKEREEEELRSKPWLAPDYPTLKNYDTADFEISGTELKKYKGNGAEVKIPLGVTSIGDHAFSWRTSIKIVIPDGVTAIKDSAFIGCSELMAINLPDSVTSIYDSAFQDCRKLQCIALPKGISRIGRSTFDGCSNLASIIIPESVESIEGYAFRKCRNLTAYCCASQKPWKWPEDWDEYTDLFACPKMRVNVVWGYRIGEQRAAWNEEQRIAREKAEAECRKREKEDAERKKIEEEQRIAQEKEDARRKERGATESKGQEDIRSRPWTLPGYPTLDNYDKTKFEISGTELKKYTGKGGDVNIPIGVTSICENAFCFCDNLKSVVIPDGVTSICRSAFTYCGSLLRITIAASVTSIDEDAFNVCRSLINIEVDTDNKNYSSPDGILYNKGKTKLLIVPAAKTEVKLPASVTSIGEIALRGCTKLKSIEADVKNKSYSSQDGILYNKDKTEIIKVPAAKTKVIIPASVTSIGGYAFEDCKKLKAVKLPDGVTSIGEHAFMGCKSLESMTFPDGVTSIGGAAFLLCSNLASIIIPESVTSIGDWAFYACSKEIKIYCRAKKQPQGWDEQWNLIKKGNIFTQKKAKVIWGYKG